MSFRNLRNFRNIFFLSIKNVETCPTYLYQAKNTSRQRLICTQAYNDIHFRQLFDHDSCTYTYLLSDKASSEAILIDPVIDQVDRDMEIIKQMGLHLKYVVNTHMHADHITGSGLLKNHLPHIKSMISEYSGAIADVHVKAGDLIKYGNQTLEVRSTPGHTDGCVTFVDHQHAVAFTGDAILIRGCGRTDFQQGNAKKLYNSVHSQILSLPSHYLLYPAHDYKGRTVTSVAEEKEFNPRLSKSEDEFIDIMDHLGLPYPNKIDMSLPANKVCGLYHLPEEFAKLIEEAKTK